VEAVGAWGSAAAELGAFVRELRRRRGWRQIDLAVALSYSEPTVSRMEAGMRVVSVADADAIVRVLDLSPAEAVALSALVAASTLESAGVDGDVVFGSDDLLGFGRDLLDRALWYRLGLRHGELLRLGRSVVSLLDHQATFAGAGSRDRLGGA
jgi:transcriptional regulator with XRE-family HTH domain